MAIRSQLHKAKEISRKAGKESLKIGIYGHDILARINTAFSLAFKKTIICVCKIRTVYFMEAQNI